MSQGTERIAIPSESAAQEGAEITRHMAQTAARAAETRDYYRLESLWRAAPQEKPEE